MNAEEAYKTALNANTRLPELEPVILQDVHWSYYYAKDVIKGRWAEGEVIIATHAYFAYPYAIQLQKT